MPVICGGIKKDVDQGRYIALETIFISDILLDIDREDLDHRQFDSMIFPIFF